MSGTVILQVHAGYRAVHQLLGVEAIAADPPYPPGLVVTAGQITVPAARFSPDRLAARVPRAAGEAWWDPSPGRYAAFHPQRGALEGSHTDRWPDHPLTRGWDWAVGGEQVAEVRAAFAEAAARARADVVADTLAGLDPEHRFTGVQQLAASRARAGGIVVHDGPWVLTWDGGTGYTLETVGGGVAMSVADQVSYAVDPPARMLLHPWAQAHDWATPVTNANPRLGRWLAEARASDPGPGQLVVLGPAAALGLTRPRTDPDPRVDAALFAAWSAAVATELVGAQLHRQATVTLQWANDPDRAVLLGPPGTDLDRARAAGAAATAALGWHGPAPRAAARQLPAAALAAAAAVVRAGIAHQTTDTTTGTAVPAGQPRVDTWRAAAGHGFTAGQVAALDATVTPAQVTAALAGPPPGQRVVAQPAQDPIHDAATRVARTPTATEATAPVRPVATRGRGLTPR